MRVCPTHRSRSCPTCLLQPQAAPAERAEPTTATHCRVSGDRSVLGVERGRPLQGSTDGNVLGGGRRASSHARARSGAVPSERKPNNLGRSGNSTAAAARGRADSHGRARQAARPRSRPSGSCPCPRSSALAPYLCVPGPGALRTTRRVQTAEGGIDECTKRGVEVRRRARRGRRIGSDHHVHPRGQMREPKRDQCAQPPLRAVANDGIPDRLGNHEADARRFTGASNGAPRTNDQQPAARPNAAHRAREVG